MFKLVIQDDEGKTTVVPLARDEITIGRKEGNTIRLTERNVSRRHARIVRSNGEVTIEDLGSYNGIRVNNARIAERVQLRVSDQVQIGDYKLFLKAEGIEHVDDAKTVPIERVETATSIDAVPAIDSVPALATPAPGSLPPNGQLIGNPNRTLVAIADTDPAGRPIATPSVHGSLTAPVGYARLVVLSSNFAGSEFELSRPQMIIGRTDENDIVINHRSISRNHAKLVREPDTGRYTISDLQSSNGVRVNGQDYGKVELRRGDVIDLGHVRMRFVDAGEEYVFTRDAIEDVPEEGRGRGLWILVALAALVLAVGSYFAFIRGGGSGSSKPDGGGNVVTVPPDAAVAIVIPDAAPEVILPDAAVVAAQPDAAPTVVPDAGTGGVADDPVRRKITDCTGLVTSESWAELEKCAQALRAMGNPPEAAAFAEQAALEKRSKRYVDQFTAAEKRNDMDRMQAAQRGVEDKSQYAGGIRTRWNAAKERYVRTKRAAADAAAKAGRCTELRNIAKSVEDYDDRAADAIATLSCTDPSKRPCADADKAEMARRVENAWANWDKSPAIAQDVEQIVGQYGKNPCISLDHFRRASFIALTLACKAQNTSKAQALKALRQRNGVAVPVPESCRPIFTEE